MSSALLLSGGVDSTAIAAWKRPDYCITVDYGQLASEAEIYASRLICEELKLSHQTVRVDCRALGSGDLAGTSPLPAAPVPEWWPFRNQLLVTLAAIRCASLNVNHILVGSVKTDACHKDGTIDFYKLLDATLAYQEFNIRISTPAISMSTTELVRAAGIDESILALTHSCHTGQIACSVCRGCRKRLHVFHELNLS